MVSIIIASALSWELSKHCHIIIVCKNTCFISRDRVHSGLTVQSTVTHAQALGFRFISRWTLWPLFITSLSARIVQPGSFVSQSHACNQHCHVSTVWSCSLLKCWMIYSAAGDQNDLKRKLMHLIIHNHPRFQNIQIWIDCEWLCFGVWIMILKWCNCSVLSHQWTVWSRRCMVMGWRVCTAVWALCSMAPFPKLQWGEWFLTRWDKPSTVGVKSDAQCSLFRLRAAHSF